VAPSYTYILHVQVVLVEVTIFFNYMWQHRISEYIEYRNIRILEVLEVVSIKNNFGLLSVMLTDRKTVKTQII